MQKTAKFNLGKLFLILLGIFPLLQSSGGFIIGEIGSDIYFDKTLSTIFLNSQFTEESKALDARLCSIFIILFFLSLGLALFFYIYNIAKTDSKTISEKMDIKMLVFSGLPLLFFILLIISANNMFNTDHTTSKISCFAFLILFVLITVAAIEVVEQLSKRGNRQLHLKELTQYVALRDRGVISPEEYEEKRKELLGLK